MKNILNKKVLIIGIDGCRPDALFTASTPNIDKIINSGYFFENSLTTKFTSSGPAWSSMFTGVWEKKHKVYDETFLNNNFSDFPNIFNLLKKIDKNIHTASFVAWEPINKDIIKKADFFYYSHDDIDIAKKCSNFLLRKNPGIVFVHFDSVDSSGHVYGYGSFILDYIRAIEKVDKFVSLIMESLRSRKNFFSEDWLIFLITDHGGSKKWHGKNKAAHRKIFIAVSGNKFKSMKSDRERYIVDIFPTILSHFCANEGYKHNLDGNSLLD